MTNQMLIELLEEKIARAKGHLEFYLDRLDNGSQDEIMYNREQYFKYRGIIDSLTEIIDSVKGSNKDERKD